MKLYKNLKLQHIPASLKRISETASLRELMACEENTDTY